MKSKDPTISSPGGILSRLLIVCACCLLAAGFFLTPLRLDAGIYLLTTNASEGGFDGWIDLANNKDTAGETLLVGNISAAYLRSSAILMFDLSSLDIDLEQEEITSVVLSWYVVNAYGSPHVNVTHGTKTATALIYGGNNDTPTAVTAGAGGTWTRDLGVASGTSGSTVSLDVTSAFLSDLAAGNAWSGYRLAQADTYGSSIASKPWGAVIASSENTSGYLVPTLTITTAGIANARVLFSDSFNIPDAADVNRHLAARQAGEQSPASYEAVTIFSADANPADSQDGATIEGRALTLTDVPMTGKGPASLALARTFTDTMGPVFIKAVLRPGNTAWSGLKWTPQRNGNWPDLSLGIALTITPGGSWTVWANSSGNTKKVIGSGQVVEADEYPVTLVFSGSAGTRSFAVLIGDLLVVPETPCDYPWTSHNLVFNALSPSASSGTLRVSDVSVWKLDDSNNPVAGAANIGLWIEGEDTTESNFYSGKAVSVGETGPSGGMFLRLYVDPADEELPQAPYFAKYKITVSVAGTYNLWVASTPQNAGWASPLTWRINDGEPVALKGKAWSGASWGNPGDQQAGWVFGWTRAGPVELDAGDHVLELAVTETRTASAHYIACVDALLLTNSSSFLPAGNHPEYSTQPTWEEIMETMTEREFTDQLNRQLYYELIATTTEQVSEEVSERVRQKIAARPFPTATDRSPETTEFGLHGMERPFVEVGYNAESPGIIQAYELLARTGVDSLRTAESCWHRLTPADKRSDASKLNLDFGDLDFQVNSAWQYGITHLFTVGYPPAPMTVANNALSACGSQHYPLYSKYFEAVFSRYKDKGLRWAELANEVDAPTVWWINSTPAQYVQEMKLMQEAVRRTAPEVGTVAFASTYSRDETRGGASGGRRFVTACFDLGIDQYADTYSLHHMARLGAKDFPAFFRREFQRIGSSGKPLLNTEQYGDGPYPYDGAKAFARVFFLHGMPRMDFFLARDFYENGYLKPWGLFDIDWRPKLRLLVYAFSVDAMRGRELVGIARPASGIEAYVLKRIDTYNGLPATPGTDTKYSIVLWKTDRETLNLADGAIIQPAEIGQGLSGVIAAFDRKLDPVAFDAGAPAFSIGDEPVAIYTNTLPDWELLTRDEYLETVESGDTDAPLPVDVFEAPVPFEALSIRQHGTVGTTAIPLSFWTLGDEPSGNPPVECRRGDSLTLMVVFDKTIASATTTVIQGIGEIENPVEVIGQNVTITVNKVSNAQMLRIGLYNIESADGGVLDSLNIALGILEGDVNGDGIVNMSDVNLTRSRAGVLNDSAHHRSDINADGTINMGDVNLIRSAAGQKISQ